MGNKQVLDPIALYSVIQQVCIRVRRNIDQKIVIHKCLRPCANVLAAKSTRLLTVFAIAEYRGKALRRRCS